MKKILFIFPAMVIIAVGCNKTQQEVVKQVTSVQPVQTQDTASSSSDPKHYSNATLGLSFDYPTTYTATDATPYNRIDLSLVNGDNVPFANLTIKTQSYQSLIQDSLNRAQFGVKNSNGTPETLIHSEVAVNGETAQVFGNQDYEGNWKEIYIPGKTSTLELDSTDMSEADLSIILSSLKFTK